MVPGEPQGPRSLGATVQGAAKSPAVFGCLVKVTVFGLLRLFNDNFSADSSPFAPACVLRGLLSHRGTGSRVTPQLSGPECVARERRCRERRRELLNCCDASDSPVTTYESLVLPGDCGLKRSHTSSFSLRCPHRGPPIPFAYVRPSLPRRPEEPHLCRPRSLSRGLLERRPGSAALRLPKAGCRGHWSP